MAPIDRGEFWQCAYVFEKGQAEEIRAHGLEAFRAEIGAMAPMIADEAGAV